MTGPLTLCKCAGNSSETCGGRCVIEVFGFDCEAGSAAKAAARKVAAEQCVDANKQLVSKAGALMNALLATVETTGTIGSVENIMQHTFPEMFGSIPILERALGSELPPDAKPSSAYTGADRLFLTTARQSAEKNTELAIKAFVLTSGDTSVAPTLHYRPMGASGAAWTTAMMTRKMAERGVWLGQLPASALVGDIEYYVSWKQLVWPAGAPAMPHTVIVA